MPAKWSKDSSVFVYQKTEICYFAEPSMFFAKIQIDEKYRTLGEGSINNVCFVADGSLVLQADEIYSVFQNELYTRSLYASVVSSGKRIGYLPAELILNVINFGSTIQELLFFMYKITQIFGCMS